MSRFGIQSPETEFLMRSHLGSNNNNNNSYKDNSNINDGQQKPVGRKIIDFLKRVFMPKGKMPHDDRINMDWLQKWKKYNRFPFKLLVHLVLTVCLTSLVFIQTGDLTEYTVNIEATWYKVFFPNDFQYDGEFGANVLYMYTIQDTLDLVQNNLNNYDSWVNASVNKFSVVADESDPPYNATLVISSYKYCDQVFDTSIVSADTSTFSTTYIISSEDLGPLSVKGTDLQKLFYCMSSMYVEYTFTNIHLQYDHPVAYSWTLRTNFDNTIQGGRITCTLIPFKTRISDLPYSKLLQSSKMVLDTIIILFSLLSQVLAWRSFMFSFKTFQRTKKLVQRHSMRGSPSPINISATIEWGSLPVRTKLRFFNLWFVICFVANLCTIVGAFLDFFETSGTASATATKLLLGFGTLLSWINLIRYLEFDPKSTALIRALGTGLPNILRFSAGSLPIFIGFALFGLMYFSETSSRFSTFGEAAVTLFGLQNGDDVQATFRATEKNMIVSRIYFFVFVFISMYAIANIYIAIMEASYSASVGIKSKMERNWEDKLQRSYSPGDELNLDDQLWGTLLGLKDTDSESSSSDEKKQKKAKKLKKKKFATNKNLTESQILKTDRALSTLDMESLVEDISKTLLEKQLSFNKELQTILRNSIHTRVENLIQSRQLNVTQQQPPFTPPPSSSSPLSTPPLVGDDNNNNNNQRTNNQQRTSINLMDDTQSSVSWGDIDIINIHDRDSSDDSQE